MFINHILYHVKLDVLCLPGPFKGKCASLKFGMIKYIKKIIEFLNYLLAISVLIFYFRRHCYRHHINESSGIYWSGRPSLVRIVLTGPDTLSITKLTYYRQNLVLFMTHDHLLVHCLYFWKAMPSLRCEILFSFNVPERENSPISPSFKRHPYDSWDEQYSG